MPGADPSSFAEFLGDYYSECDEHLLAIRRDLMELEPVPDPAVLDDLFRRFHTIKGLSGMVGVRPAEELAHAMEAILRPLREQAHMDPGIRAALTSGARLLEQVLLSHRRSEPEPDIAPVLSRLTALAPAGAHGPRAAAPQLTGRPPGLPFGLTPADQDRLDAALQAGARLWSLEFSPSRELASRGVNVNSVRARLQALGMLVHAAPRTQPEPGDQEPGDRSSPAGSRDAGSVVFEFVLATTADAKELESLAADGLSYRPYLPSSPPASDASAVGQEHPDEIFSLSPARSPSPPVRRARSQGKAQPAAARPEGAGQDPDAAAAHADSDALGARRGAGVVRVELARLDELLRLVGHLVMSRARLDDAVQRVEPLLPKGEWRALHDTSLAIQRQLRALRERVVGTRLVPIGDVLERMRFAALDLALDQHKQLLVELAGEETELDRFVVEQMLDPMLHLVRNAVSHGLESPDQRLAAGKPPVGRLLLRAASAGEQIVIDVEDDGRGIDLDAVVARGRDLGLLAGGETLEPGDELRLLDVLCSPGLTTREQADLTSGRGLGLVIVRSRVEGLGGALSISTQAGLGTHFSMRLPLTLAIADVLVVTANDRVYVVPQSAVREVVEVPAGGTVPLDAFGNEALPYRGGALPVVRLAHLFDAVGAASGHGRGYALVAGSGIVRAGLIVDRVLGRREIVAQALHDPWLHVHGITGATQLGDGRIALILDAPALLRLTRAGGLAEREEESMATAPAPSQPYILFSLAGATYGLPSRVVRQVEMLEPQEVAPLPEAPPFVDGVVLSRGQMVPAISLRARFGFERVPYDLRTRLVVVDGGGRTVGLIVDGAREFIVIADEAVQPPPEAIAGVSGDWLSGIASIAERLVLILDIDRVLSLAPAAMPSWDEDKDRAGVAGQETIEESRPWQRGQEGRQA